MTYNWYLVFNLAEFIEEDLPSTTVTLDLEDIGQKDILITRGNMYSVVYEDVMLPIDFNGENPYSFSPYAVFRDENDDVWLGIEVEE